MEYAYNASKLHTIAPLTVLIATNFLSIICHAYCNMHCFVIVLLKHHLSSPVHLLELKLRIEDSGCKPQKLY